MFFFPSENHFIVVPRLLERIRNGPACEPKGGGGRRNVFLMTRDLLPKHFCRDLLIEVLTVIVNNSNPRRYSEVFLVGHCKSSLCVCFSCTVLD